MEKAAMYGMIGALSITIGTIVIPSENFVRLKANEANRSAVPAVSMEYKASDLHENQNGVCDWKEQGVCEGNGNGSSNGNGAGYGGHHGSGHHGSGHHGGGHHGGGHHGW